MFVPNVNLDPEHTVAYFHVLEEPMHLQLFLMNHLKINELQFEWNVTQHSPAQMYQLILFLICHVSEDLVKSETCKV